jgi:DNA replication and repair protein RecF
VRLDRLTIRSFRNLADATIEIPAAGLVLLGDNGQGKTSLLEAMAYPVLFRSFRTPVDAEMVRFGDPGFHVGLGFVDGNRARRIETTFRLLGRRKQLAVDEVPAMRLVDVAGTWQAVVFAPEDVRLASGPASGRRLFLDRTLALSDPAYLAALGRYRAALAQRNAALRQGRPELAAAFDTPLAQAGATVVARRLAWAGAAAERFAAGLEALGERSGAAAVSYEGHPELADVAAWPDRLRQVAPRDAARRMTTIGPHRDDLQLRLGGRSLRDYGSTGQQRSAAIALKLLELETIEVATGRRPALLLDDVFAELDEGRQARLATRLFGDRAAQVFITAPRAEELPSGLALPVWHIVRGAVMEIG